MAGLKHDLNRYERVMKYVREGGDTGNCTRDALDKLFIKEDGRDFDLALLTLDLPELNKYLLLWRRLLIEEIDSYPKGGAFFYVHNDPKEIDL